MIAIPLAVLSSLSYGWSDFSGGLAARRAGPVRVTLLSNSVSLFTLTVSTVFLPVRWSLSAAVWGAAAGAAAAIGVALLYWALTSGPMAVLSPISAVVSALTPVLLAVVEGERITPMSGTGMILVLIAVVVISAPGRAGRPSGRAVAVSMAAGTAIGIQLICLHESPPHGGLAPLLTGRAVAVLLMSVTLVLRRPAPSATPVLPLSSAAGALDAVASLCLLLAVRAGPLGVVAVISALYPAMTILLARLTLHEQLTRTQWAGLACAGAAVILLALS